MRWRAKYYSPGIQGPCLLASGESSPPAFLMEPGTEENNAGYMQSHSCGCDQAEANE